MYQYGHLFCQTLLQHTASRILTMLLNKRFYDIALERCEYLYVSLGIVVAHVEPELIEGVWCCAVAVEPYIAALCLTEFLSIGFCYQRACQRESLSLRAECAADELSASGHISPLVVTAKL